MSFILDVDEPIAIQANVFIDGVRSASEDVEWASSDATVANVTRTGTGTASVEALKEGSCYITATSKKDNSFIAKCYVKVAKEGSEHQRRKAQLRKRFNTHRWKNSAYCNGISKYRNELYGCLVILRRHSCKGV